MAAGARSIGSAGCGGATSTAGAVGAGSAGFTVSGNVGIIVCGTEGAGCIRGVMDGVVGVVGVTGGMESEEDDPADDVCEESDDTSATFHLNGSDWGANWTRCAKRSAPTMRPL